MSDMKTPSPDEAVDYVDLPDLCLPSEVASYFRASNFTVRKWLREGDAFPHAFKISGSWRIPKQDVLDHAKRLYGNRTGVEK